MNNDEMWTVASHVWDTAAYELTRMKETIDRDAFFRCVDAIERCAGRVVTAGVGTSGAAAKKIAHSLSCIERPAFFLDPGDAVHGALGSVQPGDVAILISKGGSTRELVNIIPALQTKNITMIAVTENEGSVLAKQSNILMKVKIEKEADDFNMLATTSTMAVTAVFDALCITLMRKTGYTREQFAIIHPGGAVGERLLDAHTNEDARKKGDAHKNEDVRKREGTYKKEEKKK